MAFTQAQLEQLEAAIATGTTRVEIDGRVVQYQKLADLVALYNSMKAEIGVETPATARGKAWNPTASSGL